MHFLLRLGLANSSLFEFRVWGGECNHCSWGAIKLLPECTPMVSHKCLAVHYCLFTEIVFGIMSRKLEKWLLVQWNSDGERDIVNVRCLVDSNVDLRTGCPLNLMIKGEKKAGTLIARCNERRLLEQMVGQKRSEGTDIASDEQTKQEPSDFSSSGSSWEPSDNNNSDSDEEEQPKEKIVSDRKKYIIEKSRTKRKTLTPSHRANAVIPKAIQNASSSVKTDNNKKRTLYDVVRETNADKSLSDALPLTELTLQNVTIDFNDIIGMRQCFYDLFKKVKDMRNLKIDSGSNECHKNKSEKECDQNLSNDEKESGGNEESHRFEDASLVNNEYNAHEVNKDKVEIPLASNVGENEWVPIGSGKTLIHKDSFRKVNWKSYTIATRTLLLAAFPRRTLATHSLTGKKSPAFQNKPPKMCLDPKIISDIIIEIIGRFKVKENLVRSIITTKCADECKMYKARLVKKKLALIKEKSATKQEVENKEDTPAQ